MTDITPNNLLAGNIKVEEKKLPLFYMLAKRFLDITISLLAIIIFLPIILIFIIAIRLESKGPAVFKQRRIGLCGKPFTIYKLRGMYIDAKERFPELYDYTKKEGLDFYFHEHEDPRITKIGKFIRRTSIDELPNFINVLIGDMSLVGPRPEIPEVLPLYKENLNKYLSVKPGITCFSKAKLRDAADKEKTLTMDLEYIDTMSLSIDIKVLWLTFKHVVLRANVYA